MQQNPSIPTEELGVLRAAYAAFSKQAAGVLLRQTAMTPESALSKTEVQALRRVGMKTTPKTAMLANQARNRTLWSFFELLQQSIDTTETAKRLNVDPSRVRQRIRERTLVSIDQNGEHRVPEFQFERGNEIPGLRTVLPALRHSLSTLEVAAWFATPTFDLSDPDADDPQALAPRDWLLQRGDVEPVLALARNL